MTFPLCLFDYLLASLDLILSVCLPLCLLVYLSFCWSTSLSVGLPLCLFDNLSLFVSDCLSHFLCFPLFICISIYLSFCLSLSPSICLYLSPPPLFVSFSLFVCPSFFLLFIYLSVSFFPSVVEEREKKTPPRSHGNDKKVIGALIPVFCPAFKIFRRHRVGHLQILCWPTKVNDYFFHLLPKLRTYFYVRLIDGAARIFPTSNTMTWN